MRIVPCGTSWELNEKYAYYFDPADRGNREHKYIGFYKSKAVRAIGEMENIITANLENGQLKIIASDKKPITKEQKERLLAGIKGAIAFGWQIGKGHKFFLVKKFQPVLYLKRTKYPIRSATYIDLREELETTEIPEINLLAQQLNKLNWW